MKMGYVVTSIKIDEDKRELAKQRGLKLQQLMDDALNMALELEVPGKAQLEVDKEKLIKEIDLLEQQKDAAMLKYENDITDLKLQLKFIERSLENANEDQIKLQQHNDYEAIMEKALAIGGFNDELDNEFTEYCMKYKIKNVTNELNKAKTDLNIRFYGQ